MTRTPTPTPTPSPTPSRTPSTTGDDDEARRLAAVRAYHERTKHGYGRFARALGFLDWDSQPDPFRRYSGAPLQRLVLPEVDSRPTYEELYHLGSISPRPLDLAAVSSLLFFSLALSAWKRLETSHWSLRVNPSSGNLHPSEGYLLLPALGGLVDGPGLFHYAPKEHGLEHRASFAPADWARLTDDLPPGCFLAALSSVPWRESWKYGERAYRYCQHDTGHALAALRYGAAQLGWGIRALPNVVDEALSCLLGLDRRTDFDPDEPEHPELLVAVLTGGAQASTADDGSWVPGERGIVMARRARWLGRANTLSPSHVEWPIIEEVGQAGARRSGSPAVATPRAPPRHPVPLDRSDDVPPAGRILRQRRSAVAMDGRTGMTRTGFYDTLARLLPSRSAVPWDVQTWPSFVHLGLFVHRVADLAPGLYALVRAPDRLAVLRDAMRDEFPWERPPGCPDELPLYLLAEGDVRSPAAGVSCGQDIAADGVFSLGMLAEFDAPLERYGASLYRMLFWETGILGQVLYLEAEAAGIRSTGIGCFFDDPVHAVFGLSGRGFQSLYHFTVGGAVDDDRLTTEPAYPDPPAPT